MKKFKWKNNTVSEFRSLNNTVRKYELNNLQKQLQPQDLS